MHTGELAPGDYGISPQIFVVKNNFIIEALLIKYVIKVK
jgi:hypothetical protein